MKCPQYVKDKIYQRARVAAKYLELDSWICDWMLEHNIDSDYTLPSYVENLCGSCNTAMEQQKMDEIKKALKYCADWSGCDNCPYAIKGLSVCDIIMKRDALDLITEQEQEIERLRNKNEALRNDLINATCNLANMTTLYEKAKKPIKRAKIKVLNESTNLSGR